MSESLGGYMESKGSALLVGVGMVAAIGIGLAMSAAVRRDVEGRDLQQ